MSDRRSGDPPAKRPKGTGGRSAFEFDNRRDDESIGDLVRQLIDQGTHLADKQAELVKAEVRDSVSDIKAAAGAMAGAAILGLAGLGVTLMGVAYLLSEAMELWLATLIVGLATLAIAYAMYAAGSKKLQSSSMTAERSRRTLQRAPSAIAAHTNETGKP